jgi:hypothetical protein
MTFKQAMELDAQIRKGEKGSLVVYADSITRKETDEKTGDEIDREIPFLIGIHRFQRRADRRSAGSLLRESCCAPQIISSARN